MADPRWRLLGSHEVISTSYDVIISCFKRQRKHFWTYYISSKFRCRSINNLGETEGGGGGFRPPPVGKDQNPSQTH